MGSGSSKDGVVTQPPSADDLLLYVAPISPNSMAVKLTCKALEIEPKFKSFNLFAEEHKKDDEFASKNPYQILPTLVDGPLALWESRAINAYIVSKFGKSKSLYPTDVTLRAIVDKVLYHDATVLQPALSNWLLPIITKKKTPEESGESLDKIKEAFKKFETNILKDNQFVAGSNLTIADFSVITTMNQTTLLGFDFSEYKELNAWMKRIKALPYFAEVTKPLEEFKKSLASQ